MPIVVLSFDEQSLFSDELKKFLKTPKQQRMERKLNSAMTKQSSAGKASERSKIKHALRAFSPELHAGLQLDLMKKTRAELMRQLSPKAPGSGMRRAKKTYSKKNSKEPGRQKGVS